MGNAELKGKDPDDPGGGIDIAAKIRTAGEPARRADGGGSGPSVKSAARAAGWKSGRMRACPVWDT